MSLENVPSAIPDALNYTKILPLAVESRARRRAYLPENGQSFVSDQNNIIRIPISGNAFLDTKESYLRMRLLNTTGLTMGLDFGGAHGLIQRLTILQGGRILSDVHDYNKLLSAILLPAQGNETNLSTRSVTEGMRYANSGVGAGGNMGVTTAAEVTGACVNTPTNPNDVIPAAAGSFYNVSIPLVNGLLGTSQDKLVPLQLLGSQPIVIEITLAPVMDIGVFAGAGIANPPGYTVDDVRYMASLVEVGPEVDQHLRSVQAAAGGRLTISGTDWTHYSAQIPVNAQGLNALNIPCRRKSIKSVLFCGASQTYGAMPAQSLIYNLSYGGHCEIAEYWLKVGQTNIPQTPIQCNFDTGQNPFARAEALEELSKTFGSANNAHGVGVLSRVNYQCQSGLAANAAIQSAGGAVMRTHLFGPMGVDIEAFQPDGKGGGALESGIDSATRSLPITLNVRTALPLAEAMVMDMYVVYDSIYWIDQGGNLQVSM